MESTQKKLYEIEDNIEETYKNNSDEEMQDELDDKIKDDDDREERKTPSKDFEDDINDDSHKDHTSSEFPNSGISIEINIANKNTSHCDSYIPLKTGTS